MAMLKDILCKLGGSGATPDGQMVGR